MEECGRCGKKIAKRVNAKALYLYWETPGGNWKSPPICEDCFKDFLAYWKRGQE